MHSYVHTYMHTYIHTYIHTYVHTNLHSIISQRTGLFINTGLQEFCCMKSLVKFRVADIEMKEWVITRLFYYLPTSVALRDDRFVH